MTSTTWQPSPVKRARRTNIELEELDAAIIAAVEADYPVTLRGVYYRAVSASAVPKTENGYKAVGRRLLVLRRDGRISYDKITDGTRYVLHQTVHDDVEDALNETARLYRRNLWRDQHLRIHLFTEKDAISGVVAPIAYQWCVPLGVLRGYCSESFAWEMAAEIAHFNVPTIVYQLGDHDPSGVGAWNDFQTKVARFAPNADLTFERLAVTADQITEFSLPTRPTKKSDTRARDFTGESVEVDAIPAPILRRLVSDAIEQHIDPHEYQAALAVERSERSMLRSLADGWTS